MQDQQKRVANNVIFKKTSADFFQKLSSSFTYRKYYQGDTICKKGEKADCIYLILSGSVNVVLDNENISKVDANLFFGAMGYLNQSRQRNSAVYAGSDCQVCMVSYDELDALKLQQPKLFEDFLLSISSRWIEIIEHANSYRSNNEKKVRSIMNFFCTAIFLSIVLILIARLSTDFVSQLDSSTWVTSAELVFFVSCYAVMIYLSSFSLRMFGFSLESWRRDVIQSVIWSVLFLGACLIVKAGYIYFFSPSLPLFELPYKLHTLSYAITLAGVYALFCFAQEFIARGVMQGVLMTVAETNLQKVRAISLTILSFAAAHLHLPSLWFAAAVIVPGFFWSILYERQRRRLLGVCLSHCLVGVVFLNFIGWHAALV